MYRGKKGSAVLAVVVLALAISLIAGTFYVSNSGNLITGELVGIQTIGVCNISVTEDILNIGHDYICNGENGFIIKEDNVTVNCQGHSITCNSSCGNMAGFLLGNYEGVNITNCVINNFTDGFRLYDNAYNNFIGPDNILTNNTDGVDINNATFNNINHNYIYNSPACGINISAMNNSGNVSNYNITSNKVWDNYIINSSTGYGACSDATSYNYWNLEKNVSHGFDGNITNIINGTYLGGNFWSSYHGEDVTGDGLGDTDIPYKAGGILNPVIGDEHPLVDACALPGTICGVEVCDGNLTADAGGEGLAIVCSNSVLDCAGGTLIGNNSGADHMRGIEIIGIENVTIQNCEILNFTYGIYIRDAENVTIKNSFIHDNNVTGIYLGEFTEGSTIYNNTISNEFSTLQTKGVWLRSANPTENGGGNNNISSNIIRNQTVAGIYFADDSDNNLVEYNDIYYNEDGVVVNNSDSQSFVGNEFYNNSGSGLAIYDSDNMEKFGEAECVGVTNHYYNNGDVGLLLERSSSNGLVCGNFTNNFGGIGIGDYGGGSNNLDVGNAIISDNSVYGLAILDSTNITINGINVSGNNGMFGGVLIANSTFDLGDQDSYVYNNSYGFKLVNVSGASLAYEAIFEISKFTIYNNSYNVYLENSDDNTISGLKIFNSSTWGLYLNNSFNNLVYNNYFNNTNNAWANETNDWNSTYNCSAGSQQNILGGDCLGGNFWENYLGEDISGDGIGDTSDIPFNESDNFVGGDFLPLVPQGNISCGVFTTNINLTHNLTVNGTCFSIDADGIIVNCNGNSITGNGTGRGIALFGRENVTVKNCKFYDFDTGIYLSSSHSNNITSNVFDNNSDYGVYLTASENNSIVSNTAKFNLYGVGIHSSSHNNYVYGNLFSNHSLSGVNVGNSNFSTISSNNISNSSQYGILMTASFNSVIMSNYITNSNIHGVYLFTNSANNSIYNNYFGNNSNNADDSNTNYWNTSYNCSTGSQNIINGPCWGGNFWEDYVGLDDGLGSYPHNTSEDGIGDTEIPYNSSGSITGGNGDFLPLMEFPVECGNITFSVTLTKNLTSNGTCFIILADGITIDFAGYSLTGNGSGVGVNISSYSNVTIEGGNIENFTTDIYADPATGIEIRDMDLSFANKAIEFEQINDSVIENNNLFNNTWAIYFNESSNNNITNNTIYDNSFAIEILNSDREELSINNIFNNSKGIYLTSVYNSTFINNTLTNTTQDNITDTTALYFNQSYLNIVVNNTITENAYGFQLTSSYNNTIYNNWFSNTQNAIDDGTYNNTWNSTYDCTSINIKGGDCMGGNYWSDYTGKDQGGGSFPYDNSTDGIGDTQIPYTKNITGGDYLPLTNETAILENCTEITNDLIMNDSITCTDDDAITVGASGITLDCDGHSIIGNGTGAGIKVDGYDNIVIKNCNITNFYYGIELLNTDNVQIIENNTITENDFYGIYLFQSTDTLINDSQIVDDNNGVYMISSNDTTITGNIIDLNKKFYGIYSYGSDGNEIHDNNMTDNYHGIYFVNSDNANVTGNNVTLSDVYSLFMHSNSDSGIFVDNYLTDALEGIRIKGESNANTFTNNTVLDHDDYGIRSTDSSSNNFEGNVFYNNSDSDTYHVYLSNSSAYIFNNNNITGSTTGFAAFESSHYLIINHSNINSGTSPSLLINDSGVITITNNSFGNDVELNNIPASTINYNTIINTTTITNSDNLTIVGNNITAVFDIYNSDEFNLSANILVDNYVNISSDSTIDGNSLMTLNMVDFTLGTISDNEVDAATANVFNFTRVSSTDIIGNDIQDCDSTAILLTDSDNNNVYDNWLKNNDYGLNVTSDSSSNVIYNNYFRNDEGNVYDANGGNTWNTANACGVPNIVGGPCKGGNFYSNYYGLDNGANGREQGDGVGDQPPQYTVTPSNTDDTEPLVLYVARQYFAPDDNITLALTATASISGELSDEEVVPNEVQVINYSSGNNYYMEMIGLFNQSDVHAEDLVIHYDENRTFVNKTGVTGEVTAYTVYLNHDQGLDAGLYICPDANNLSTVNETCSNIESIGTFPATSGSMQISAGSDYYLIENVTDQTIGFGLNVTDPCGANAYHDITLTEDLNCSGTGINVAVDNISVDCDGKTITGANTLNGIYVYEADSVEIRNCYITKFNNGVLSYKSGSLLLYNNSLIDNDADGMHLELSNYTNVSNNLIQYNEEWGIYLEDSIGSYLIDNEVKDGVSSGGIMLEYSNNSLITSNTVTNNTGWGIRIFNSINNEIYNNYFSDHLYNALDDGSTNYWNTTYNCSITGYTNIIGGACQGGNYWSNYAGNDSSNGTTPYDGYPWNITNDGIGNTEIPYNSSGYLTGGADYLPLVINSVCGDNVKEGNEECDGSDYGGLTCSDYSYLYGSLSCNSCTIDSSGCTNSSGGSGSSGGGSGSSGGGGVAATADVNCTQSWSCYDWSDCVSETQTRTCYDLNDCEAQKDSGVVDNVIEVTRPGESKSCEVEVTYTNVTTPTTPGGETVPPITTEPSAYLTFILSGLGVLLIFGGFVAYMEYGRTTARLRRRIKKTRAMLPEETVEALKREYKGIYVLYLKLSEKDKQNFFTSVNNLRGTIEEQLKAEKIIEKQLTSSGKGSLQDQKKNYLKIYKEYQKLAPRSQEKFYPQIVNLRERLEGGR